jgi:hypothetical protein
MFTRVYRLEIQSVMMVFSAPLVNYCPSTFSMTSPTPSPPSQSQRTIQYIQAVCGLEGGGGERGSEVCVVDHILQEFNTLFVTRFRTYTIATPPQTKNDQ